MRNIHLIVGPVSTFLVAIVFFLMTFNGASFAGELQKLIEFPSSVNHFETPKLENDDIIQKFKRKPVSELKLKLDNSDFIAALKALHIALMEVGDGTTFLWRKSDRHLSGSIKPTEVFRDPQGRICRHVIFALSLASYIKTIESIACRESSGEWVLEG